MSSPIVREWLCEPAPADVRRALTRLSRLDDLARMAVMPDVHLGEGVCVGCVLATRELVYPNAVGADIGCGIATVALEGGADLAGRGRELLRAIAERVPVMRHRSLAGSRDLPEGVRPEDLSDPELARTARREGRIELGTLGRGNHFLEAQADRDGRLWLMVHSGSRIMGQVITAHHLARASRGSGGINFLPVGEDRGRAYLHDLGWALRYASASRRAMLDAAAEAAGAVLGARAEWGTLLDTHHNHVRRETHGGASLLVHRKGASPAGAGERGLIPGCMGGASFHVTGRGVEAALCSSSHGAGRAMSRSDARRRIRPAAVEALLSNTVFDDRGEDAMLEEAPMAYKDIRAVMRAQRDLVKIERETRGMVCYRG